MLDVSLFKKPDPVTPYIPTEDEITRTNWIKQRISDMQQARVVVDRDWNIYQTMIDAIWTPYVDERSSSTVPLASSMIELAVADAIKIKPEFTFRGETSKYAGTARAFETVWKYVWRKQNFNKPIIDSTYITFGFGHSVLYASYESYSKIQKDMIIDPESGDISWEENTIEKEGITLTNCDIRQFYIDNQAIQGIEDASDCAYRQWMSRDKFQNLKNNPLYKNVDKVTPKGYSNDWKTFITIEEAIKAGNYVEIWMYWNVEKDCYVEIANGIEVREHPMVSTINGEKALPFTVVGLGKKNFSIYYRGFCEALLMFNHEINTLREMLMDGIRRSNSQVLAIGNGLKFNGRGFSYDNQILTFDGKLGNDNFQQITGTPPNQAIFSYIDRLYKDISIFIGIDIQNIMGEPDLTAYQTEVKRESSQKRMNVWLASRDLAFNRLGHLLKDLIQTYFPKKDAEGLYPQVEVEDGEITQGATIDSTKFKKKKGVSTFQVTPDVLRGDIYLDVFTNTSAPTIGAVDRDQKKAFLTDLGVIANNLMLAKQAGLDVESVLPVKSTLRDLAADYGLEPIDTTGDNEELDAAKKAFMQQLITMKQGVGAVPQAVGGEQPPVQGPAPTPQALPSNSPQGTEAQIPTTPQL